MPWFLFKLRYKLLKYLRRMQEFVKILELKTLWGLQFLYFYAVALCKTGHDNGRLFSLAEGWSKITRDSKKEQKTMQKNSTKKIDQKKRIQKNSFYVTIYNSKAG